MRKPVPDAGFAAQQAKLIPPCDGDCDDKSTREPAPFYRPDESRRLELARVWLRQARGGAVSR